MGDAFNYVPAGPIALVWSIVYQYLQLVPNAYQFRVFGVELNDKIWVYALAGLVSLLLTTPEFSCRNNLFVNDPCNDGIAGHVECAFSPLTHSCWSLDRVHLPIGHSPIERLANSPKVCFWSLWTFPCHFQCLEQILGCHSSHNLGSHRSLGSQARSGVRIESFLRQDKGPKMPLRSPRKMR